MKRGRDHCQEGVIGPQWVLDTSIVVLNPIIRGWADYYRHISSKESFSKVDYFIFQIIRRLG